MGIPKNPDTIIIKNRMYQKGIREIDIWDYYQKAKPLILKETINRNVMFAIMTEANKFILKRKGPGGIYRLNPKNYNELITGRTSTIYSEMGTFEDFGIIDIDINPGESFAWAKQAALDVYDFVMDKMPIARSASIRFTGKSSFHIICDFGQKIKIDTIRHLLQKFLTTSDLSRMYTIDEKRRSGIINLDLSPNKFRGAYITLGSLSVVGLRCMEVPYNKLLSFYERNARII